ncbi:MAG: type II toxin-antitoxin system VapC family toxin [Thermodesulfobacteriota bacterium]
MFLLDTDTVIYALKGHAAVLDNLREHLHDPMYLSSITMMELYYGAYKSQKVDANLAKLKTIESTFTTVPPGQETAEPFGKMKAALEDEGLRLADMDLMIAAIALTRNLTLVTNNQKHFGRIAGLKLVNWAR